MNWTTVGTDPVFVLLSEDHPLAGEKELELSSLAEEHWTVAPGDGCFADCFAAACARAAYADAVRRSARYADWLATNPEYGAVP